MMKLLKPLETKTVPVRDRSRRPTSAPHWVRPELVAQIKFTEWTADGKLRHPVYLGLRDDKKAADVTRERESRRSAFGVRRSTVRRGADDELGGRSATEASNDERRTTNGERRTPNDERRASARAAVRPRGCAEGRRAARCPTATALKVTNLHKLFWPKLKLTKGDLMRYYARVAPFILPAVADRPLVMKRFPNGVAGAAVLPAPRARGAARRPHARSSASSKQRPQIIGGSLKTLLYMTQLAAISQDPWFSRVRASRVRRLRRVRSRSAGRRAVRARARRRALDSRRARRAWARPASPKTSGADGLHIYIPLPPGTPYEAGMLYCQIVAALVEQKHPKVGDRPSGA